MEGREGVVVTENGARRWLRGVLAAGEGRMAAGGRWRELIVVGRGVQAQTFVSIPFGLHPPLTTLTLNQSLSKKNRMLY